MTPIPPSRRTLNAEQVAARLGTGISARWVRKHFPYKVTLSQSRVFWFEGDVSAVIEKARATGTPVRDVRLEERSA